MTRPAFYRQLFPLISLLVLALAVLPHPARAQETDPQSRRVDSIMATFQGTNSPGAVVAVVRKGEIVFQRAYGMANLTHGVPFTVDTRTNIGSTSKQFTAFAVAFLARDGRLSLDDDVRSHIPELPDLGETVTLRHLISHTSGYREFLNALAMGGWRMEDADHIHRREIVEVVQRQPALQNSPGAEWNYNNTGYALLAMVVERVTGESFPDWMADHVFGPVGMKDTAVRAHPGQIVPHSAQGYVPAGEGAFREASDIGAAMGAGGIYTTVGDLARWMRNLGTGEVGGREIMEQMTTPYVLTSGDTTNYGFGLMMDRDRGLRRVQHGGADAAHRSHFAYYPDLDAGLMVLSNNAAFPGTINAGIAEVFFGEHMELGEAPVEAEAEEPSIMDPAPFDLATFDPASFDVFVGRYELEIQPGFILTFRREGDRLLTQATGQPSFEITPTSDSTFALSVVEASVTFHRDEDGAVTGLTLHQNGHHAARRLPEEGSAPDLSPFAGRYYSAEFETYYTGVVEEDALVLRHRRRDPVNLTHASGDTFNGSFPLVEVVFERDESGGINGFRASNVRARDVFFERMR
jgi:CubicO group peptidase (beta-lactamase class C family)